MQIRVAAAAVVALTLCLTGCAIGRRTAPDPTPTAPVSTPTPTPTDAAVVADVGDVRMLLDAPPGATFTTTRSDGSTRVVARRLDGGTVRLTLQRPKNATFSVELDGSVAVMQGSDDAIAGIAAPREGSSATTGAIVRPASPTDAGSDSGSTGSGGTGSGADELLVAPDSGTLTLWFGDGTPRSAVWGVAEGGRSLAVDPSTWARAAGQAGADATWTALAAERPDADVPGMHDQLTCHAIGAPDKATWNLEPWRPAVGLAATLAARCNPR